MLSFNVCVYNWAFLVAQMVKNLRAMPETQARFLGWEDSLKRGWLPTPVLEYWLPTGVFSCLENPIDRGAWQATVHEVAKSQTRLSPYATHLQETNNIDCLWEGGLDNCGEQGGQEWETLHSMPFCKFF